MPTSHQLLRRTQDVCPRDSLLPAILRHILGKLSPQESRSTNQRHGEQSVSRSQRPVFSSLVWESRFMRSEDWKRAEHSRPPGQEHQSQLSEETGQSHDQNSCVTRNHHPQHSSVSSRLSRKQVCLSTANEVFRAGCSAGINTSTIQCRAESPKRVYFHPSSPDVTSALTWG